MGLPFLLDDVHRLPGGNGRSHNIHVLWGEVWSVRLLIVVCSCGVV